MKLLALLSLVALTGCHTIQTQIEINAPARKVHDVLYKFDDYPKWNPFIVKVDGDVKVGNEVTVAVKLSSGDKAGKTTIDEASDRRLAWTGGLAVPGVFRGAHEFVIEEAGPNKTIFKQNEKMSGAAVPLLDKEAVKAGFEEMNKALKAQAEAAK